MGEIVALEPSTWSLFADLVERQGGLFGGCWCTWSHVDESDRPGRGRARRTPAR